MKNKLIVLVFLLAASGQIFSQKEDSGFTEENTSDGPSVNSDSQKEPLKSGKSETKFATGGVFEISGSLSASVTITQKGEMLLIQTPLALNYFLVDRFHMGLSPSFFLLSSSINNSNIPAQIYFAPGLLFGYTGPIAAKFFLDLSLEVSTNLIIEGKSSSSNPFGGQSYTPIAIDFGITPKWQIGSSSLISIGVHYGTFTLVDKSSVGFFDNHVIYTAIGFSVFF